MRKLKLVLGVHNDLSVGATEEEFEHAYQYSLKPFLTVLYKYPKVRTAIHYSGVLFEWFEDKHPEFIMLINELVKRRQIELIGGAYYGAALPIIPSKDRVGQIEMLTTYIRKRFGKRPRGCWITEGVWEPSLASTIKSSGMEYLFLDDIYFDRAGLTKSELFAPFITDDQGKPAIVIPLHNDFIMSAFSDDPRSYLDKIEDIQKRSDAPHVPEEKVLSIMWNGEYFIANADRYKEFFSENGWLENFFSLISKTGNQMQTVLPGKYLRNVAPFRRVYFPGSLNVANSENKDAHQPEAVQKNDSQRFLATATGRREIRNYFRKNIIYYPESARLYSKMMYVHLIVGQVRRDRSRKKTAKEESWRGQENTPFWHSPSGGIYDNRTRKAAYCSLIEAEKTTREKGIFSTTVNITDIDLDGVDEYLYQGQFINAYVHRRGASVFELDYVVTSWNYQDLMARYREPYHDEKDLEQGIDVNPRSSFIDHLFEENVGLESYLSSKIKEKCNFKDAYYFPRKVDKDKKDLEMDVHRWIENADGEGTDAWLHMQKYYDFQKNSVNVGYRLQSEKAKRIRGTFGTEINLSFPESEWDRLVYTITAEDGTVTEVMDGKIDFNGIKELAIHDKDNRTLITLTPSQYAQLWSYPIYTITKKYGKKVKVYQGSCYYFLWDLELGEEDFQSSYERSVSMRIEKR